MTKNDEQVLVIPTSVFIEAGRFQGFLPRPDHYLPRLLDPRHLLFMSRGQAEQDPSFKQIIPYVLLRHGDLLFHYTRGGKGGEQRLRALRSIGLGGHINPLDAGTDPYRAGLRRELAEEVQIETTFQERCLGLINDDSTPVGQVHLGIVHVFDLAAPKVRHLEEEIFGFAPRAELLKCRDAFETWSRFALDALTIPCSPADPPAVASAFSPAAR